jgi:hypothetical protein
MLVAGILLASKDIPKVYKIIALVGIMPISFILAVAQIYFFFFMRTVGI